MEAELRVGTQVGVIRNLGNSEPAQFFALDKRQFLRKVESVTPTCVRPAVRPAEGAEQRRGKRMAVRNRCPLVPTYIFRIGEVRTNQGIVTCVIGIAERITPEKVV